MEEAIDCVIFDSKYQLIVVPVGEEEYLDMGSILIGPGLIKSNIQRLQLLDVIGLAPHEAGR
jgi:hypothetical protein